MIEVREIHKHYGSGKKVVQALRGVSLRCEPGEVYALLGPNGSGKTTLLRCVAGLMQPSAGEIQLGGVMVAEKPVDARKLLGFLTGSMKMPKRLTGRELLRFFGGLRGLSKNRIEERTDILIQRLQLQAFIDQKVGQLSMGQTQRVAIAQALIHDPKILVLDEITVGLDVLAARDLIDWVKEVAATGYTVLFSTHQLSEVRVLAERVGILNQGKLIYDGSLCDLAAESETASLEDEFIRRLRAS